MIFLKKSGPLESCNTRRFGEASCRCQELAFFRSRDTDRRDPPGTWKRRVQNHSLSPGKTVDMLKTMTMLNEDVVLFSVFGRLSGDVLL